MSRSGTSRSVRLATIAPGFPSMGYYHVPSPLSPPWWPYASTFTHFDPHPSATWRRRLACRRPQQRGLVCQPGLMAIRQYLNPYQSAAVSRARRDHPQQPRLQPGHPIPSQTSTQPRLKARNATKNKSFSALSGRNQLRSGNARMARRSCHENNHKDLLLQSYGFAVNFWIE